VFGTEDGSSVTGITTIDGYPGTVMTLVEGMELGT